MTALENANSMFASTGGKPPYIDIIDICNDHRPLKVWQPSWAATARDNRRDEGVDGKSTNAKDDGPSRHRPSAYSTAPLNKCETSRDGIG